jgi:hypothetical protein
MMTDNQFITKFSVLLPKCLTFGCDVWDVDWDDFNTLVFGEVRPSYIYCR